MRYGANADGSGSKITFSGATTVTTNGGGANGLDAYGLYASNGGAIDGSLATGVAVTTSGTGAIGVYASGPRRRRPDRRHDDDRTRTTVTTTGLEAGRPGGPTAAGHDISGGAVTRR